MAISLIAKIEPKNDGFLGLVDAKQVIGDGLDNVLPANTIPNDFVKLDQSSAQNVINGRLIFDDGLVLGISPVVGTHDTGKIYWDISYRTAVLDLQGTDKLRIGMDDIAWVYNGSGYDMTPGQAVYIYESESGVPSVRLAKADDYDTSYVLGLVGSNTIYSLDYGYVIIRGYVNSVDTDSWNENDLLYLDGTTAGSLTNIKPNNGINDVLVGRVMIKDPTVGRIFVDMTRPLTALNDLADVTVETPAVDDYLYYNGTEWVNYRPVKITVGTTEPVNPEIGDLWVDSN